MIVMAAAVVADGGADFFGNIIQIFHQIFDGFFAKVGIIGDGLVQVRHIGRVMFVVMNLHRSRINVRFERVVGIGQRWQREWSAVVLIRRCFEGQVRWAIAPGRVASAALASAVVLMAWRRVIIMFLVRVLVFGTLTSTPAIGNCSAVPKYITQFSRGASRRELSPRLSRARPSRLRLFPSRR